MGRVLEVEIVRLDVDCKVLYEGDMYSGKSGLSRVVARRKDLGRGACKDLLLLCVALGLLIIYLCEFYR
jgi:hypothetical protein